MNLHTKRVSTNALGTSFQETSFLALLTKRNLLHWSRNEFLRLLKKRILTAVKTAEIRQKIAKIVWSSRLNCLSPKPLSDRNCRDVDSEVSENIDLFHGEMDQRRFISVTYLFVEINSSFYKSSITSLNKLW